MINWIAVCLVPLGALLGSEIGRRRAEAAGKIYSFLPNWFHRLLIVPMCFGQVLFFEAALSAYAAPTDFLVRTMFVSGGIVFIALAIQLSGEMLYAKRLLDELGGRK